MLVFALLGPRVAARRSSRVVARIGLVAVSIGAVVMLATLDVTLQRQRVQGRAGPHRRRRRAAGLAAGQRHHVGRRPRPRPARPVAFRAQPRTSAPPSARRSSAPCCSARWRPASATPSPRNADIPAAARETIVANVKEGIDIVPVATVEEAAVKGGLPADQAKAIADDYGDAQLDALRLALGAVALARCCRSGSRASCRARRWPRARLMRTSSSRLQHVVDTYRTPCNLRRR